MDIKRCNLRSNMVRVNNVIYWEIMSNVRWSNEINILMIIKLYGCYWMIYYKLSL
jgi:hypothetical protein